MLVIRSFWRRAHVCISLVVGMAPGLSWVLHQICADGIPFASVLL